MSEVTREEFDQLKAQVASLTHAIETIVKGLEDIGTYQRNTTSSIETVNTEFQHLQKQVEQIAQLSGKHAKINRQQQEQINEK